MRPVFLLFTFCHTQWWRHMHFIILKMIAIVAASECTQFVFGRGSSTLAGLWGTLLLRGREEEGRGGSRKFLDPPRVQTAGVMHVRQSRHQTALCRRPACCMVVQASSTLHGWSKRPACCMVVQASSTLHGWSKRPLIRQSHSAPHVSSDRSINIWLGWCFSDCVC